MNIYNAPTTDIVYAINFSHQHHGAGVLCANFVHMKMIQRGQGTSHLGNFWFAVRLLTNTYSGRAYSEVGLVFQNIRKLSQLAQNLLFNPG